MPPVILTSSPLYGVLEPGHPGTGRAQNPAYDGIAGKEEAGILCQEADRIIPGLEQQRPVQKKISDLEVEESGLTDPKELPGSAQLHVLFSDPEPVRGLFHDLQPFYPFVGQLRAVHEE